MILLFLLKLAMKLYALCSELEKRHGKELILRYPFAVHCADLNSRAEWKSLVKIS
ncbi:Uncharacterized protein TCM_011171 [Theobroma cacao]|uniref:Uncharacterized protein n=1 Tax=Theobroma cacao TaxID=3641 RepID=A0A061E8B8_THECC|nr:Uncharacterized protein TCM_011171 [Theobroma cacao]